MSLKKYKVITNEYVGGYGGRKFEKDEVITTNDIPEMAIDTLVGLKHIEEVVEKAEEDDKPTKKKKS